jgi:hypothetical protein
MTEDAWMRHLILLLIALVLVTAAPVARAQEELPTGVTLRLTDATLVDAALQLRWASGASIVVQLPETERSITVSMRGLPLPQALDAICEQAGATWRHDGVFYTITPKDSPFLTPLVVTPDEDYFLATEKAQLNAADLIGSLTPAQWQQLGAQRSLPFASFSPAQQEALRASYGLVGHYLERLGETGYSVPGLENANLGPIENLIVSVRTWAWRWERL